MVKQDLLTAGEPNHGAIDTVNDREKSAREYIEELKAYTDSLPDPNEGRIQELKELIRKGKLVTKEAIRETADKLAQLFISGRLD